MATDRPWIPKSLLVTPAALQFEHGAAIVRRAEAAGTDPADLVTAIVTEARTVRPAQGERVA